MSPDVKVCPHCGHGRGAAGSLGDVKLSTDEARALLTMSEAGRDEAPSSLGWFLMAHPATHGKALAVERIATVIATPIWATGFLSLLVMGRRRLERRPGGGEVSLGIALGLLGLLTVWPVAGWIFSGATTAAVVATTTAAWTLRTAIRYRAGQRRSRSLSELDRPARRGALPPPRETVPAPVATTAPEPVEAAPLTDGPRRLR